MANLMDVRMQTLEFPSSDGRSTIHARAWWPPELAAPKDGGRVRPRAVLQLVHGMAEHISRYDDFACTMALHGVLVCGHDQIGHGDSSDPERWGCIPEHDGVLMLLKDIGTMRDIVSGWCSADTPYFVLGHSFGSFLVRDYLPQGARGLSGAIISGTGYVNPAKAQLGCLSAHAVCRLRGQDARSEFLHSMADGAYAKAIPDARTPFDWLSHNQANVDAYIADPACGFMFSAGGYVTLTKATLISCAPECACDVPHDLPLLYISGAEDPVGDCSRGVQRACDLARQAGSTDVTLHLYPHMRHEILNETGHEAVYADILAWMEERI